MAWWDQLPTMLTALHAIYYLQTNQLYRVQLQQNIKNLTLAIKSKSTINNMSKITLSAPLKNFDIFFHMHPAKLGVYVGL